MPAKGTGEKTICLRSLYVEHDNSLPKILLYTFFCNDIVQTTIYTVISSENGDTRYAFSCLTRIRCSCGIDVIGRAGSVCRDGSGGLLYTGRHRVDAVAGGHGAGRGEWL